MIVTRIEKQESTKYKIFIDYEYAFLLDQKELEHYPMEEGTVITDQMYTEIIETIVWEHSKQKALNVLKFMDRSEQELRKKLSEAGYTDNIINRTISYVEQYGYLDDTRFAANYLRARMNRKSKIVIQSELLQKGIRKDIIDLIIEEAYGGEEDAELLAIRKIIAKKTKAPEELSPEEKRRLMASLYRKGFDIGKIKQVIN